MVAAPIRRRKGIKKIGSAIRDGLADVQEEASRTSECTRAGYLIERVAAFPWMRGSLGRER